MNIQHGINKAISDVQQHSRLRLELEDDVCNVSLFSSQDSVIDWVRTYLYTYFDNDEGTKEPQTIRPSFEVYHSPCINDHSDLIDSIVSLGKSERIRYYWNQDATQYINGEMSFIVSDDRNELLLKKDNRIYVFTDRLQLITRIVRDVFTRMAENTHKLLFQCSGVELNGRGILICSNSGSGKTSLMLNIVRNLKANLVSNDRVYYSLQSTKLDSWPTGCLTRYGDLTRYPEVNEVFKSGFQPLYPQESFWNTSDQIDFDRKLEIIPFELSQIFGIRLLKHAIPHSLFLFDRTVKNNTYHPLSQSVSSELLSRLFFSYDDEMYPDVLGLRTIDKATYSSTIKVLSDSLANRVAAYQIYAELDDTITDIIQNILTHEKKGVKNP